MTVPVLTHRGFWTRIVVFGGSLLVYTCVALIMAREHFYFGVGFIALPVLLSLIRFIVIVVHRPSHDST